MQYEFEKKESETALIQMKKDAIAIEEKRKQKIILWCIICGLGLVTVFSIVLLKAFSNKKKANKEITLQKMIIEEKQKAILDSIYYAKRIQLALLTPEKYIRRKLFQLNKNETSLNQNHN